MSTTENRNVKSLAVSLSGGGHRATLFVLGALMYLVDAKANASVTSIASVSGGSLTNGLVGQEVNFRQTDGNQFRQRVASPLATQIALKGTLFTPFLSKLYLVVLILWGMAALVVPLIDWGPWYVRLVAFIVLVASWGWFLGKRGRLCASAFRKTLFSPGGRTTSLSQIRKDGLDHVICSTELRSAEQVYFAGDFVYSYALGYGKPADTTLAQAVQASAAYPGGFPPATLPARRHDFTGAPPPPNGPPSPPDYMVLADGGVYDNMGDQWARGFADRVKRWKGLADGRVAPNQLVVVNASARVPWSPFRRRLIPLIGEVLALLRVMDVMYVNTTNVRRQVIVASYNPADPRTASALPSVLVQISQSPFVVANAFSRDQTAVGQRARDVIAFLKQGPNSEEAWAQIANDNSAVSTNLSKLGADVSARLIYHGYVVMMCNLHVFFGEDYPLRSDALQVAPFRALIS
ncbi:MAG TPA: patatin-like phospholipase family protein [Pyrinomonadaceae bacterium]|nr:patatin-like phospholipase family protein [Pyrinomonadaceae bacterium]